MDCLTAGIISARTVQADLSLRKTIDVIGGEIVTDKLVFGIGRALSEWRINFYTSAIS
jgi:hypothetical protein